MLNPGINKTLSERKKGKRSVYVYFKRSSCFTSSQVLKNHCTYIKSIHDPTGLLNVLLFHTELQ